MIPMVGLAYWPLFVELPLLGFQCLAILFLGRNAQTAARGLAKIFIETPLLHFLRIVWVVMFVLCLDCLRGALKVPAAATAAELAAGGMQTQAFETQAAKEGCLVLTLNLVSMPAIFVLHMMMGRLMKLELDRDIMKRQAAQQGEFAKQILQAEKKTADSAAVPQSTMPAESKEDDKENELRKRAE
eukprot:TRINITY_DN10188_c0_g1_i1.p1 TRINITY_DN10188_c0_g1~~TRINITY_DN10188_c0_g1_i1.p1  ORF type:complete len:186 (-),score=57.12 TRINITY_DN10188_c0_g1_i1:204-761(-)